MIIYMSHLRLILSIIIIAIMIMIAASIIKRSREHFGPCSNCDQQDAIVTGAINPYIWPCSGTNKVDRRDVWDGVWMPKSTDSAEALLPPNKSSMNVLTVPDEEYKTN